MSRTLFVDAQKGSSSSPNGTLDKPFRTINAAVKAAAALQPAPSADDPVVIAILQGIYTETVFVNQDGLCLRGLGGLGTVAIRPRRGPALVVTNSTPEAIQLYRQDGDPHALAGTATSRSPHSLQLVDLDLGTPDPDSYAVYVVGDPNGPPVGDRMITLSHCSISLHGSGTAKALHAYFCHYIWIRHNCEILAPVDVLNCGGVWVDDSGMLDFTLTYDRKHDLGVPAIAGFPGGQFGLVGNNAFFAGGTVTLRGDASGGVQPTVQTTFWDLAVRGTSTFETIGGYANSIAVEGGARWYGQDVHVQGNLTFDPGSKKVQLDGGRILGKVSDPSGRFVRNLGT